MSSGPDQVVMWSYPIMQDGLIYVVEIRNGLYVLEYNGPYGGEGASTGFQGAIPTSARPGTADDRTPDVLGSVSHSTSAATPGAVPAFGS